MEELDTSAGRCTRCTRCGADIGDDSLVVYGQHDSVKHVCRGCVTSEDVVRVLTAEIDAIGEAARRHIDKIGADPDLSPEGPDELIEDFKRGFIERFDECRAILRKLPSDEQLDWLAIQERLEGGPR